MSLALEIVATNKENTLAKTPLYLVCKRLNAYHMRSTRYNLARMLFSLKPLQCKATYAIRSMYQRIESIIPYVQLKGVCVLARVAEEENGMNDVCVLGNVRQVVDHFVELASAGIVFHSLEVYPRSVFLAKGRKQYINKGYGVAMPLGCINVYTLDS